MNKLYRASLVALWSLSLAACVTINIYFPAAAAEKAADKIIDEVWQLQSGKKPETHVQQPVPEGSPK